MGCPSLARQLVEHGLVDEYRLMIEPILLGGGKSIFPVDGEARPLELVSVGQTGTGVLMCAYRPVAAEAGRTRNGSDGTRTRDLRRDRPAL